MPKKLNPENRHYTVMVKELSSGEIEEHVTFPVLRKAVVAKRKALAEAKRLSKVYDEYFYSLCCMVSTGEESENIMYLDKDGGEDTIFIDWLT